MKTCKECQKSKGENEFYERKATCKSCVAIRGKAYRKANYDKIKKAKRKYAQTNRDKEQARIRAWHARHPEKQREYYLKRVQEGCNRQRPCTPEENIVRYQKTGRQGHLKRKFGITQEDYDKILLSQNGKCAICGEVASSMKRALHIDHSHEESRVRGLLCVQCNMGLGCFRDNSDFLLAAIKYLRKGEVRCG